MNILIVDTENMALDFALRCAAAGHAVKLCRYSPKKPVRYGEGFKEIALVEDWRPHMEWARDGLIVNTGNYILVHQLQRYREFGFPVFGPSPASARIEIDRMHGMKVAEAHGLNVPEYHTFVSLEEAEAFARKQDRGFVFKPGGDEENKALTFVASDPAELVGWLRRQIAAGKKVKQCLLQEKVDVLSELGVSGWMGLDGFLPDKWSVCIEHKKLMDGEIGPATGEQGTVMQYCETDKLADGMLKPLEPMLRSIGHRGDFAVGAIIDTSGKAWFLEVTARFGYPAWWIQSASHKGDPAKWMKDLLAGKDSLRVSYDVAIGVVMAQPHYPYALNKPEAVEGNPISGADEYPDQVHLASVMQGKGPMMRDGKIIDGPQLQTAGEYVAVCTGLGKTVEKARTSAYRAVKAVKFPDRMYRTDIGEKVIESLPALHRHGYAVDME
ncbi:MAG TPA: phosphoribosylglycinamide synthetase C domain-containing protein [Bradyrhizobium sp.]|nr:phosphoribosylglycinamide synthetase C domain-containing protein [Bradyrhizobium sp.]